MPSPQEYGRRFEIEIHELLNKTKYDLLLNETQIRKYNNTITAIDHILFSNNIYYCFQDKWLKTPISNSDFNHFIKCVENFSALINNQYNIYAIYISNTDFSSVAIKQFVDENTKYNRGLSNIEYIKINSYDKKILFKYIQTFLHNTQVYMYDKDGDCIML